MNDNHKQGRNKADERKYQISSSFQLGAFSESDWNRVKDWIKASKDEIYFGKIARKIKDQSDT